jgi:3-isopropylmalate/(R)-2-methylmalate dehydratase large subunit
MDNTLSEKILAKASGQSKVKPGDFIKANVDIAMMPDVTAVLAFKAMRSMGSKHVWNKDKVILILDHVAPASSINSANVHRIIRDFVKEQRLKYFYDVQSGVCHQVLPEQGHVNPGKLIIGADSHTCTHGAFGTFATGVGSTDMGAVLSRGKIWLKVPETFQIQVNGKLNKRVYAKDIILNIVGKIGVSGAIYKALEFTGSTIADLSISGRMTLCNMAIEMGGKTGICEPDKKTFNWLKGRSKEIFNAVFADPNPCYKQVLELDVGDLEPQIACPHNVDNIKPISKIKDIKINQVFIGSCTNGRLEDLQQAHGVLKGRQIHPDVRLLVVPASREVYSAALEKGIISDLVDVGAIVSNPSCAACFGGHIGLLGPGEKGITTSNRNFRGRQGSPYADVYISSAAVAAASALTGQITHPGEVA